MNRPGVARVKEIEMDTEVRIFWKDNKKTVISFEELRFRCPCAACVDEFTGERRITREQIKQKIAPIRSEYVGNYALRIFWNDGHSTGIYTFRSLRESFPAEPSK